MVAFTVSAGALTYGLTRASGVGWGSTQTIGTLALSAVALIAFVVIELRVSRPLLDLALLRRPASAQCWRPRSSCRWRPSRT